MRRLALVALIAPLALFAQDRTGVVRGVVTTSESRAPIYGAQVTLTDTAFAANGAVGVSRTARTNAEGAYVLRGVPAGTYRVTVTALGRAPRRESVAVAAGQSTTRDVSLAEGSLLLSSVIVSATLTPTQAAQVASAVDVLTPQHIQTSPARESQDLLREIPSVELPRTSSLVGGTAQIVSIRGVDEGRTAVLFDGVPVNDAWGEWIDWGRVPKGMLDRVEVIQGGTSSLYGNGAMGGVISFFGRGMAPGSGTLTVDGGSRSVRHLYVGGTVPVWGALTATANGDYQEGGGYTLIAPAHDDVCDSCTAGRGAIDIPSTVIQRNAYLRLTYAPAGSWSAFVTGHKFGDTRATGTPLAFARREQQNVDLGVNYAGTGLGAVTVRAWDGNQTERQRSTALRNASATSGCPTPPTVARQCEDSSVAALIPSHDWGGSAMWTRPGMWGLESFSAGGDFRHYQGAFDETDFGACPAAATCNTVARKIWSGGDQGLSGAFLQAVASPIEPLRAELSARVDHWSNTDAKAVDAGGTHNYPSKSVSFFSPRLGLRYQVIPSLSFRAAAYRAFRAPNLAELYRKQISSTSITLPNPELRPESALGREGGFDWQPLDMLQLTGTWYVAEYKDFNVPTGLSPKPAECGTVATCRQRLNVSSVRSKGGELTVGVRPIEALFVSAGVNYDDARNMSDTAKVKPHVNRVPSPRQTIRGTYTSPLLGAWTAIWRHEGRTTTLQGVWLDPFTVIDLNAQREIMNGVLAFASVENVTDQHYQVNVSGTGLGAIYTLGVPRTVRAGLTLSR